MICNFSFCVVFQKKRVTLCKLKDDITSESWSDYHIKHCKCDRSRCIFQRNLEREKNE